MQMKNEQNENVCLFVKKSIFLLVNLTLLWLRRIDLFFGIYIGIGCILQFAT